MSLSLNKPCQGDQNHDMEYTTVHYPAYYMAAYQMNGH